MNKELTYEQEDLILNNEEEKLKYETGFNSITTDKRHVILWDSEFKKDGL